MVNKSVASGIGEKGGRARIVIVFCVLNFRIKQRFNSQERKTIAHKLLIQSWNLYQVMGLDVLSRDLHCESPDNMPQ